MLHTEEGEEPCNVIEIAEPMLIKEEQSLNSRSGRSFAQEYSLATRGPVSHFDRPTTEGNQEGNPFSCKATSKSLLARFTEVRQVQQDNSNKNA